MCCVAIAPIFFIKRGHDAGLMNPRTIWRTSAFQLAEYSRPIRVEILRSFVGKEGESHLDDAKVKDQFHQLIQVPLLKFGASILSELVVVIIDALDECVTDSSFPEFLDTIVEWSKTLPKSCKLILSSRADPEIEKKLAKVCHSIVLDTGDGVSEATSNDIRYYFETKFRAMDNRPGSSWPGPGAIDQLMQYAAGNFGWADSVVGFVGHRSGERTGRLNEVLNDMSNFPENYMSSI